MTDPALAEARRLERLGGDDGHVAPVEAPPARYRSTRLADVVPERVEWLWPGWIPRGMVTVLDGPPGAGKSTLTLDLAARVTTGRPMPGEQLATVGPSDVVIMSAEDPLAQVIRPRLDAAGADCSRVHHLDAVPTVDDGTFGVRPPSIPGDVDAIEALVSETGAVLVIVDVIMAYLHGSTDSYRDQDVRRALAPVAAMAERTGAAVVLLRHPRKSGGTAMAAGGGSIAIGGAARSWLAAAPDPDDDTGTRRVLAPVRPSLAAAPPSRTYILAADDPMGHAHVEWTGTTTTSADALYTPPGTREERTAVDDATEWLRSMLADEPRLYSELRRQASTEGIADRTLARARERLGVIVERDEHTAGRPSTWALPPDPDDLTEGGEGYVPPPDGTYPVARTPRPADQGKRADGTGTCHVSTRGTYPPGAYDDRLGGDPR